MDRMVSVKDLKFDNDQLQGILAKVSVEFSEPAVTVFSWLDTSTLPCPTMK